MEGLSHLLQEKGDEGFLEELEPYEEELFGAKAQLSKDGKYKGDLGILDVYLRAGGRIGDPSKVPFRQLCHFSKDSLKYAIVFTLLLLEQSML